MLHRKAGPKSYTPRAQMFYIPIIPIIQTHYSVLKSSEEMRYRDRCLQETLKLLAKAGGVNNPKQQYSDFVDSTNHVDHLLKWGYFMMLETQPSPSLLMVLSLYEKAIQRVALYCGAAQPPTRDTV
jgi:hypothetical protein